MQLDATRWPEPPDGVEPLTGAYRKDEVETDNGPVDYALYLDRKLLAMVEAKTLSKAPQEVLTQAERYAEGVKGPYACNGFGVPFIYSSNGEVVWFRDLRDPRNRSRQLAKFHTPTALEELLERDFEGAIADLVANPSGDNGLRHCHNEASAAIESAIGQRKRRLLVAMATGTGKTMMIVNEIYRLMSAGLAKRVLFLVDRRVLAAQAVRTFASFEPEPGQKFDKLYEVYSQRFYKDDVGDRDKFDPNVLPKSYLTEPGKGHMFVYVTTTCSRRLPSRAASTRAHPPCELRRW